MNQVSYSKNIQNINREIKTMKLNLTSEEIEMIQKIAPMGNDIMLLTFLDHINNMLPSERKDYLKKNDSR